MSASTVTIELPSELLQVANVPLNQATREVKKMLVLYLYARGHVSLSKACELLGISQWEFFELNKTWGMPMHYDAVDYHQDLATLKELSR